MRMWAFASLVAVGAFPGGALSAHAQESLHSRLQSVSRAFREGDATLLRSCLPQATRIHIDLPAIGFGAFAAGQLEVMLQRGFHRIETQDLAFAVTQSGSDAYARGRWSHRMRAGGEEQDDTLTLTLRLDGGEWRIFEMRSSP
jgi:hypothetical protein